MYFVVGSDDGESTARFQYQIFPSEEKPMPYGMGWLAPLHFGYTQASLWNLSEDSAPFKDSSYRPSFYWEFTHHGPTPGMQPHFLRFGYEHESNGQAENTSRSIDTLFLLPVWETSLADRKLSFLPKVYAYLDKEETNSDIDEYRGYGDYIVRYGRDDELLTQVMYRRGESGRDSIQLDLSWPLRTPIMARAGGYLHVQLFQGYGESLLTYDEQEDLQVRVGFSIVR